VTSKLRHRSQLWMTATNRLVLGHHHMSDL
jgi:hypothetical protein